MLLSFMTGGVQETLTRVIEMSEKTSSPISTGATADLTLAVTVGPEPIRVTAFISNL